MELARFGVRVNAVLPGFVPTELVEGVDRRTAARASSSRFRCKSFGEVEDVASLVMFLASPDDSEYMTGALLAVDGGASAMLGTGAR